MQALGSVLADFTTFRELLNDAFQTASTNNAKFAEAHARDMRNVHELAVAATDALSHLQAEEVVRVCNNVLLEENSLT